MLTVAMIVTYAHITYIKLYQCVAMQLDYLIIHISIVIASYSYCKSIIGRTLDNCHDCHLIIDDCHNNCHDCMRNVDTTAESICVSYVFTIILQL